MRHFSPGVIAVNRSALLRWVCACLFVLVGIILALPLQVNDDAMDLLPGEAVRGDLEILMRLGLVDRVFLTLSVNPEHYPSSAAAQAALKGCTEKVGEALAAESSFSEVLYRFPNGYEWELFRQIEPHLASLLTSRDLSEFGQGLALPALENTLHNDFVLLNTPAGLAIKRQIRSDPLGLTPKILKKMAHLKSEYAMTVSDGYFVSKDGLHTLVMAQSVMRLTDSANAGQVFNCLRTIMGSALQPGMQWRVIGSLPHTLANAESIQHDLKILLPVATILLLILIWVVLRDWFALSILGVPFLAAPMAIAIMGMAYGRVSALALGFGIVLLGIAVDFAVHIYVALSREPGTDQEILRRLVRPVTLATLTTAGVFVVLFFSQVVSHRQMAALALSGVCLAVMFSWLLIPTLVKKKKIISPPRLITPSFTTRLSPVRKIIVLGLWLGLIVAGINAWPALQYNGDLRVLDAPNQNVIEDERYFRQTWQQQGEQVFVVAAGASLAEALDNNYVVYSELQRAGVEEFSSLAPLLPGPVAQQQNMTAWRQFWAEQGESFVHDFQQAAAKAGFSEIAFRPFFEKLDRPPVAMSPERLMAGPLKGFFSSMIRLPEQQGVYRDKHQTLVLTTVKSAAEIMPILLKLDADNPAITVLASQKWRSQVENLLRQDIATLSGAAAVLVFLVSLVAFRRMRAVIAVLAPVVSALAAMALFSLATSGELNMMHVLMGIMVIGLSVDYGVFVVCSISEKVSTTTFLAVSMCAASSLIGFGVLAFARHPALHSLGVTVLCGIGAAWPTALLVSPIIISSFSNKGAE